MYLAVVVAWMWLDLQLYCVYSYIHICTKLYRRALTTPRVVHTSLLNRANQGFIYTYIYTCIWRKLNCKCECECEGVHVKSFFQKELKLLSHHSLSPCVGENYHRDSYFFYFITVKKFYFYTYELFIRMFFRFIKKFIHVLSIVTNDNLNSM